MARQLAIEVVRQVREQISHFRYVAYPRVDSRLGDVYLLSADGASGPALWQYRCRPGDGPRVLRARVRGPVELKAVVEIELTVSALVGGPLCLPDVDLELVDTQEPDCVIIPRRR